MNMLIWSPGMTMDDVKEQVANQAYNFFNKNSESAAKSLQINLDDFNKKMENFRVKSERMQKAIEKEKKKEQEYHQRARGILQDGVTVKNITD